MTETCKNCHWWDTVIRHGETAFIVHPDNSPEIPRGRCRRKSPGDWLWPVVREDDWCGDWERLNVVEPVPTPIDKNFDR